MRTKNSLLNFLTSYIFYFLLAILGFVKVKVFIGCLGEDLFSLNQLYINLFSYLSLAEGGLSLAFLYHLYPLLSLNKYNKINEVYSGIKQMFKYIGLIIILFGLLLSFFLPFFIKGNPFSSLYLTITFLLFILKSTIDYFMFAPRLIMQADHKMFKVNITIYSYRFLEVIIEIILLLNHINYLIILIPSLFIRYFQNYHVNKKVFYNYPWLRLTKKKDKQPQKDIKHLFVMRIVELVNNNTDIIILSTFLGSRAVSCYSAYFYLFKFALDTNNQIFNAVKDGLGNVFVKNDQNKNKQILKEIFMMFFYLSTIIIILFSFVINPFIILWIGNSYLVSNLTLILMLIILYLNINIRPLLIIKTLLGHFQNLKKIITIEAILNILLSIILVNKIGFNGVLIGTLIAFLGTSFWYFPCNLYKTMLKNLSVGEYFLKLIFNSCLIIILIYFLNNFYIFLLNFFSSLNFLSWLITSFIFGLIIMIIVTVIFIICYKDFRLIILRIKKVIKDLKLEKNNIRKEE